MDDMRVWVCETDGGGTVGGLISRDADMAWDAFELNKSASRTEIFN
jgi:hypothetical protein